MKRKNLIIGICGGIAAYKIPKLIKLLLKENISVLPIMTYSASRIIDPKEIEKAANHVVYLDLFKKDFNYKEILKNRKVDHIKVADSADLVVIVPATANILGKVANGIADDFLTTTIFAATCPVLVCPSMNVNMWNNPVIQDNIIKLKKYGYFILEPALGMLACGYEGPGRLPDIEIIKKEIHSLLNRTDRLRGKTIIVTAGGTIDKIDEIRIITNRSSGKMGIAIAEACYECGANVILLRSKHSIQPRYKMKQKTFETAEELLRLLRDYSLKANICFHVAAVSDFKVRKRIGKIASNQPINVKLFPRQKLYRQIKTINPGIFLITFKAEWRQSNKQLINSAKEVLSSEPIDVVVVNDVGRINQGFETNTNEVIIVEKNSTSALLPLTDKRILAKKIVEKILL